MISKNSFVVGSMRISIFLPSDSVPHEVILPQQTHGTEIVAISTGNENVMRCDALITENHEISLGIRTADCAPICFSDGVRIGIAHVGWRGLCFGLTEKMIGNFDSRKLAVYVAPFLHSFEIKRDFCYEKITEKFDETFIEHQGDKLVFNCKKALDLLLPQSTVYDARNTEDDLLFPSNRRDLTKDRFVTAVSFR